MKKILFVATVVKTHIMEFHVPYLKMFKDMGWETAVAARNDYKNPADCVIPYCDAYYDIPFARNPLDPSNLAAFKELKEIIEKGEYTIIHCHTPVGAMITRLAAGSARKKDSKVFYTAHGFHFYKGAPLINWLLYYPAERILARKTDVLITINKEDYEKAKSFKAGHVEYIPGVGVDIKAFADTKVDREQKRRELDIPEDDVLLLSVGELNKNKNHEIVIRSLAKMQADNVHYMIAGSGPLEDYLKSLSESLGIKDRVRLLGYRNDVAELYKAADIFVFPSIREGLPISVIEAMAAGLPVVAAKIRGVMDLLEGSDNPLLDSCNDVDAFVREISRLCEDKNLRGSIGKANQLLSKEYEAERIIQKMKSIYISSEK